MSEHAIEVLPELSQTLQPGQVMELLQRIADALHAVEEPREAGFLVKHAEAAAYLAEKAEMGLQVQNRAVEVTSKARHRAGALLAAIPRENGGRPVNGVHVETPYETAVRSAGVSERNARRWQQLAAVPEAELERFMADKQDRGQELTSAAVMGWARNKATKSPEVEYGLEDRDFDEVIGLLKRLQRYDAGALARAGTAAAKRAEALGLIDGATDWLLAFGEALGRGR